MNKLPLHDQIEMVTKNKITNMTVCVPFRSKSHKSEGYYEYKMYNVMFVYFLNGLLHKNVKKYKCIEHSKTSKSRFTS